jgi:Family of unknown function (DUF6069)
MAAYYGSAGAPPPTTVDAGRLWAGGFATALVAGLLAVVGVLITRVVFDIAILTPLDAGGWGGTSTAWYAVGAAAGSLAATGLAQLLVTYTPRPMRFFTWVMVLSTAVAIAVPFVTGAATDVKIALALLNLTLGVAIGTLVAGSARGATRRFPPHPPNDSYGRPDAI